MKWGFISLTNPLLGRGLGSDVSFLWTGRGRQAQTIQIFADCRTVPFEQEEIGKVHLCSPFFLMSQATNSVYSAWDKCSREEKPRIWSQKAPSLHPLVLPLTSCVTMFVTYIL